MPEYSVSRSQLKVACEGQQWDLLDKLLEADATHLNDNALFTDTWGTWWGLLIAAIHWNSCDGVRVLLKHGAHRACTAWGDGMPYTALEAAEGQPEVTALLLDPARPEYVRTTDPPLPARDEAVERQGRIRDGAGLVFPSGSLS